MTHTAVIAGVGPGLGESVARRFHAEGCSVGLFARSAEYIQGLAEDLGERALAVPTDIADPEAVAEGFAAVREAFGPVDVLANNASGAAWKGTTEISHAEFDRALDVGVRSALYCSQEAVEDMLAGDGGTVVFTGATTSVRGREGAIGFSANKFAARGMAESMARELGPEGIHIAHVVIDGQILAEGAPERTGRDVDSFLDPDAIADAYWDLVEQDRTAWTLELDLRPYVEQF
jgi:NAD(P)-dependent dehydrogenase (short-subunit alcohol dehydrogenase family)